MWPLFNLNSGGTGDVQPWIFLITGKSVGWAKTKRTAAVSTEVMATRAKMATEESVIKALPLTSVTDTSPFVTRCKHRPAL